MKKKVIPFLFSLFLLASCGDSEVKPCETHTYGDWTTTKQATCGEAGSKERTCSVCQNKETAAIDALTHDYRDAASQTGATAATCGAKGTVITECANCGAKSAREVDKLTTHSYPDEWTTKTAATCAATGVKERACTVCGNKETDVIAKLTTHSYPDEWTTKTQATHTTEGSKERACTVCGNKETGAIAKLADHSFGDSKTSIAADHDLAAYDVYTCADDNARKLVWDAKDVSYATKNDKYNNQDNYTVNGEGVRITAHPIHNGVVNPNFQNHTPVFDENVPGSFIEYTINVKSAMTGAQLIADMQPQGGLPNPGGLFMAANEGNDWTPGLMADSSDKGYKISDFRFVVMVNGVTVEMDASKNIAGSDAQGRKWYNFPCTVDLVAGVNSIKIVHAGGWEPTFYNFGVISADAVADITPVASEGFTVGLTKGEHITSVKVFEDKACTIEDTAEVFYSRNEAGRKVNDETGQISFEVTVEDGYQVAAIKATSATKVCENIRGAEETGKEGLYRIEEIKANCEFVISAEPVGTVHEGYQITFDQGEHITKIEIYNSKTYKEEKLIEGLVATSLDETFMRPTTTDGQVYFKVFFEEGYKMDTSAIDAETKAANNSKLPYKNLKSYENNCYRLTKVSKNGTVMIRAAAIEATPAA